ncbi:HalOD1 output domain-containing protein [Natronoarchaeum sp. GCM10025703]|uniref:HalOD1 output domain-containing protein n=1 Tax=unclassified Natronoarchaeum TaxID=2620183 RepID=UPI003606214F
MDNEMVDSSNNSSRFLSQDTSSDPDAEVIDLSNNSEGELVVTIVERVADITDQDVTAMPPLYDSVNPGALADLMSSSVSTDLPIEVSFWYQDCQITVSNSGTFTVETSSQ